MHLSRSALKYLKAYLIIQSLLFTIGLALSIYGGMLQSQSFEYFYSDYELSDNLWDQGSLLIRIAGYLLISNGILIFILTGIVLSLHKIKMKPEGEF